MEDFSIRAIVIGVSLFVTMLTLTAILLYFNTAREAVEVVNKREDIASSYDRIMNSETYEDNLSGVDVRTLINKYAESDSVEINIIKIGNKEVSKYQNINNNWLITINNEGDLPRKIISEEKLDLIDPAWTNHVDKVENRGKIILNLTLNV